MSAKTYTVAVVGGGPRGLAALEYLYEELLTQSSPTAVKSVLFEPTRFPGSGPVYAPDQSSGNWLNIPRRLVDIPARSGRTCESGEICGFPSYHDWFAQKGMNTHDEQVDHYPRRAELGMYLNARFNSLADSLMQLGWLTIVNSEVEHIDFRNAHVSIACVDGQLIQADEVVLTLGHQAVEPDESMRRWQAYTDENPQFTLLCDPYPTSRIVQDQAINSHCTVAIRGFGLAMIDVVKGLTEARGGRFVIADEQTRAMSYEPSGNEPLRIVPFSLDGLPLVPKPINADVDQQFDPGPELKRAFKTECTRIAAVQGDDTDPLRDLIEIVSKVQVTHFLSLGNSAQAHSLSREQLMPIARGWLADAVFQHDLIVSTELPAEKAMRTYVRMACALAPFSFDYCLGQVWRHLQEILFECFSHAGLRAESISDIVQLHERMKRYSYGPPVDAMQRLIALSQCALLSYAVVDDPDIELTSDGWKFEVEQASVYAPVLIDSVLASPDINKVSSPLVRRLRNDGRLKPFADSLGAKTSRDGRLLSDERESSVPLTMLGRLTKGSLIGTDSVTACFDEHQKCWARNLVARLSSQPS